jgi:cytochrome c-type biogenesis protein CcmH/NrfF
MQTRKYPRTMQQAFGPHTNFVVHPKPEPMHRNDKIVLWGCAAAVVVVGALVILGVVSR